MKRTIAILFLVLLSFASSVMAQGETDELQATYEDNQGAIEDILQVDATGLTEEEVIVLQKQKLIAERESIAAAFNNNPPQLPDALNSLFANERISLYFEGDYILGVAMEDGIISEIVEGEISDPSLNVYVSDNVFKAMNAQTFTLEAAIANGDIKYSGVGFGNKIKFGILSMLYNIATWFT